MICLITGGNGFIGSHLAERLVKDGHHVRVLVQHGTSLKNISGIPAQVFLGDILIPSSILPAIRGCDVVFHLAALVSDWGDKRRFIEVNANGTRNVLDMAVRTNVRRFVFISSLAVHRFVGIKDGNEDLPRDNINMPYGLSKIIAEDLVMEAYSKGHIESVIIRPGVFPFGPRDRTSFLPLVLSLSKYAHVGGGTAHFCTAYAENLAYGIVLAGQSPNASGRTYVIADGQRITWREFIDKICEMLNHPKITRNIPRRLAQVMGFVYEKFYGFANLHTPPLITQYRISLVSRDCYFGISRAQKELGYYPPISVEEGLRRTIEWCKTEINLVQSPEKTHP